MEGGPVGQLGEAVVHRGMRKLALQRAAVGDVLEHQHRADDGAVWRAHGRGRGTHVAPLSEAPEEHRFAVEVVQPAR